MTEGRISIHEREVWVVEYLKRADPEHRTIRAVWEDAQRPKEEGGLADGATLPTYHRTVAKLVRRGQLEPIDPAPDGAARYMTTEQMSPLNTFTLTDLHGALWELSAPQAFALYVDAVDYYESRADHVLRKAAIGLTAEDPRALICEYLQDSVEHLKDDVEDLLDYEEITPEVSRHTARQLQSLRRFVHGELGINARLWRLPTMEELLEGAPIDPPSWNAIERALGDHVFGKFFIEQVNLPPREKVLEETIIAGSDGSSHAGFVRGVPAPSYAEEEGRLMLTFNNSIAYVEIPERHPQAARFPYHGVPMTRAALEDPHNRGMIISRPWFDDLSDSEFEHMKKAALDVVQFRVDERLMTGAARAYGTNPVAGESGLLPKPNVLIRDGTVTPQEREFQHYTNPTAYGDVVREGIALSYSILKAVKDSRRRVFAGAVKSTQLKVFSRIVNWYVKRGSARQFGQAIDPTWDIARASHVTDSVAISRLLRALPELDAAGSYYRTCIIARPFPAMVTSLRELAAETGEDWLRWFQERRERQIEDWKRHRGERPLLAGIVDLEDDAYVRMCQQADHAMFYFGRPGGDPQINFPRFEFMDALRELTSTDRIVRVLSSAEMIMAGVDATRWTLDRDHNFLSRIKLPRLVPYVVYEAHEKCKVLGHKLEAELRQAITANLARIKAIRGTMGSKVEIESMSLTGYLTRAAELLGRRRPSADEEALPEGDDESGDVVEELGPVA